MSIRKEKVHVDEDKREAERLRDKIRASVNHIPPKVITGSSNTAVAFKRDASKALTIANGRLDLARMKNAWQMISTYYRGE